MDEIFKYSRYARRDNGPKGTVSAKAWPLREVARSEKSRARPSRRRTSRSEGSHRSMASQALSV